MMLSTQRANAQDFYAVNNDGDTLYYNITSPTPPLTVEVTNPGLYIYYTGNIVIPESVTNEGNTYSVSSIGERAFSSCLNLTMITIPNSVTSIGEEALSGCPSLTFITIPNSVTIIGEYAFSFCSGLTSISIPHSVISIGMGAFYVCENLTSFDVDPDNPNYSSVDGVLFNKLQDILLECPDAKTGSYTIPNTVTSIGEEAFRGCESLTSITIPNSVISIRYMAFAGCEKLTSVTIPNSVTTIGESAFTSCHRLISVIIGSSVITIEDDAFYWCGGLSEIYVKAINPPKIYIGTFAQVANFIPVYVCGSVEDYRNAPYWSDFTNILPDTSCNVGIADIYGKNETTIYPNPATDNISISLPENISQAVFTLYDMQGKVLINQEVTNQETVAINNLASGIYIYNVKTSKQNYQGKLIRK
jgi:hypothetical protein